MSLLDKFKQFSFKVYAGKVLRRGVLIVVAWIAGPQVAAFFQYFGVTFIVDSAALNLAIWSGLEGLRQVIKTNVAGTWLDKWI